MAYTNETTHYGIPLPLGSDLTTPMDYNESMQDVDTALFESKTDSSSALQKANQLQLDLATTNDNLTGVAGRVTTLEGTSVTQGQAILQNTQDIADVRADALDMICAVDEGTAQVATVAHDAGTYFRYNDVLYRATSDIAIGDTIVPNTNCVATNVATELGGIVLGTIIPTEGDTFGTMAYKLGDFLHELPSEMIPKINLVIKTGNTGATLNSGSANVYRIDRFSHAAGYYSFNTTEYGNRLEKLDARLTGSTTSTSYTDLRANTTDPQNIIWAYNDYTDSTVVGDAWIITI